MQVKEKMIVIKDVVSFDLLKVQIPLTIHTCEKGALFFFKFRNPQNVCIKSMIVEVQEQKGEKE